MTSRQTAQDGDRQGVGAGHGALMDSIYRYQRHIYDASRKYFLLGRDELIDALQLAPGQSALEVGCGTGRNLILAARHYPDAEFFGFDISNEMLVTAKGNIEKAGLADRITLRQADATDFSASDLFGRSMDCVFYSYTISMIPGWQEALAQGVSALNEGGKLHVVDFGQQDRLPAFTKRLLLSWLTKFHVAPRGDLKSVLAELAADAGRTAEVTPLYRDYAWLGRVT